MKDPLFETDPAARLYSGASGRQYHEEKRFLRPEVLSWVMRLRAEKFQPYVQEQDVVFEFGTGAGWNLGLLKCARRIGCDASAFLREQVIALGAEFVTDMSGLGESVVDLVICHQALEHVLRPAETLRQFARILKPGGRLILHVPWERELRYAHYRADEPNHHLYNWNAQNIANLVSVLGYNEVTVRVRRYGYDRFAANLAAKLRVGEQGFRFLRAAMLMVRPLIEVELIAKR